MSPFGKIYHWHDSTVPLVGIREVNGGGVGISSREDSGSSAHVPESTHSRHPSGTRLATHESTPASSRKHFLVMRHDYYLLAISPFLPSLPRRMVYSQAVDHLYPLLIRTRNNNISKPFMQTINLRFPQQAYKVIKVAPHITTRTMSLFPRSMFTTDFPRFPSGGEFTPLFRLLDDYASHQLSRGDSPAATSSKGLASFTPKFDVKETKQSYELHGELPGIEQKDVQIEFSDANTLTIKGRTERYTESGTPPTGLIDGPQEQAKLADTPASSAASTTSEHYHKPTVEEANEPATSETASVTSSTPTPAATSSEVAKTDASQQVQQQQQQQPKHHYWVSERSVGEFHRSFSFPTRVDHENVKASLKNGILSIIVPKSQAPTTRRIEIE